MKVLVTGANGSLGSLLVRRLALLGHAPRALVRPTSDGAELAAAGVDIVRASYVDAPGLATACTGVDAIVHCAGGGKARSVRDFYRANTDTTRALIAAARAVPGLRRFVLVSSLAAHGPARGGVPADEASTPRPVSDYGKSKLAAERAVLGARGEFPVTILRPPAIYGPTDTRMVDLYRWARRGVLPMPGRGGLTSMVYSEDCVSAMVLSLEQAHESGSIYFVAEESEYSHDDLSLHIARAMGRRRALTIRLPIAAVSAAAVASEVAGKLRGAAVVLTRDKVKDLRQTDQRCSASRLRRELGWAPEVAFPEGAERTARGYEARGWL